GTKNRKRSNRLQAEFRRGLTPVGTSDANGAMLEIATQDDGGPWSPFRTVTMGQLTDTNTTPSIWHGGIFRRRRYWIRYSGVSSLSLISLAQDAIDLGS